MTDAEERYLLVFDYRADVGDMDDDQGEMFDGYSHEVRTPHSFRLAITKTHYPDIPYDEYATYSVWVVQNTYHLKPSVEHERLFVVYNFYSDGDTFGHAEGLVDFVGVTTTEWDAQKLFELAKQVDYEYFGKLQCTKIFETSYSACEVFGSRV